MEERKGSTRMCCSSSSHLGRGGSRKNGTRGRDNGARSRQDMAVTQRPRDRERRLGVFPRVGYKAGQKNFTY